MKKKNKKRRINGVSALRQQTCGTEINLLAKDKRAAKITAGKRKLHQRVMLEEGVQDGRGVRGERCDGVARDRGGSSHRPAGQCGAVVDFTSG